MLSLKNICLNLIAQEFERFHFAFVVSTNDILKRNFDFLQRKYSFELATVLSEKRKLKDEYLNFLLNDHLKCFDCNWLYESSHCIEYILCRLPNLEKICSACNDKILENVAKFCPKIIEIDAPYSPITDTDVKYLCKNENGRVPCPKLKVLCINLDMVTDGAVQHLVQNLTSLEKLDMYDSLPRILYSLHKKDLPKLENIRSYNFVELNLLPFKNLPHYTDLLKICLYVCPKVTSVACLISNKEQLNFFNNIRLEHLKLFCQSESEKINVGNFFKCYGVNITGLIMSNCIVSITDFAASCPQLKSLFIEDVTFLDTDNSQIVLDNLERCYFRKLEDESSTNKAVGLLLSSSSNLEHIEFMHDTLSADTKIHILNCCEKHQIMEIHLLVSRVDVEFAKNILLSCTSKTRLNLYDYQLSDVKELIDFSETLAYKPDIYIDGKNINKYYETTYESQQLYNRFRRT